MTRSAFWPAPSLTARISRAIQGRVRKSRGGSSKPRLAALNRNATTEVVAFLFVQRAASLFRTGRIPAPSVPLEQNNLLNVIVERHHVSHNLTHTPLSATITHLSPLPIHIFLLPLLFYYT